MMINVMDPNVISVKDEEINFIDCDSATSNSSVVNGDAGEANSNASNNDDTFSSDHVFTFNFGILKVNVAGGEADEEAMEENTRDSVSRSGFVTRELFPVNGITEPPCRSWSPDLPIVPQRQQQQQSPPQVKKGRRGPRSRSSQYRGVTFYRRTGRWESHIWDCGKQIYLGGFDTAHSAARAYDRAAIQFRGAGADINFTLCDYEEDLKQMKHLSKEEFVHILRRLSNGSSRRSSKYRGVANGKFGKWEAQMEEFLGKRTHEKAAIVCNERESVTNFVPSNYESEVVSNSQFEDSHHDLDLYLGISNNFSKENGSQRDVKYHPYDVQNRKIQKVDNSRTINNQPLRGRPLISQIVQLRTGVCSNSAPICKETTQDRIEVASSQGPPKWAWQMQGQLRATPMTVVSTAAASSGFSSPVTTGFSASSHLSKDRNPTALNLCFSAYRP